MRQAIPVASAMPMPPSGPFQTPRRFVRRLTAGLLLLNLLALTMAGLSLQHSRQAAQASAFTATGNLAHLLEHQLTALFDRFDLLLQDARDELARHPAGTREGRAALDAIKARRSDRLPELDALRVTDEKGVFIYGGTPGATPIADREFFRRLRDDPAAGRVLSGALISRASGKAVIVLARRLSRPDGSFAGIVSTSIALNRLQQLFATLDLGPHGAVTLRDAELRLVARHPTPPASAVPNASPVVSAALRNALQARPDGGNFMAVTSMDQVERANAYRRVDGYPLYILVGQATDDYLAEWRLEAARTAGLTLAIILASLLFARRTLQAWKTREEDMKALARQEQKFRSLLESAPDALLMVDRQGLVSIANTRAGQMFGYPRAELIGQPIEILVPEHRRSGHAAHRQQYIHSPHERGMGKVTELRALRKDGTEFPVEISLSPLETEQGMLVTAAIRDVTERERANASLRESEERFRLVVEGVQDYAIYLLSPDGLVLNWNAGAERIKQWPAEEIIGRHFSVFYPPEDAAAGKPAQDLAEAARLGHCRTEEMRVRRNGSCFWASVAVTALRDEQGRLKGYAKLTRDITERKRHEQGEATRSIVLNMLVAKASLPAVLDAVAHGVETQLPGTVCAILLRDAFAPRLAVVGTPHLPPTWLSLLGNLAINGEDCFAAAASSGQRVLQANPGHGVPAAGLEAADPKPSAIWCEPIRSSGDVLGVLAVFRLQPVPVVPEEYELVALERAAILASIAVERRRSDEALELAASVYEAIGEAIMLVDADNRIEAVNPAFSRLTGFQPEEILGATPQVLSSGRHDRSFYQRMWHSLDTTGRWQGEIRNRRRDGGEFVAWLMITSVFDGDVLKRRIALFSGITDHKRAEEAVWRQANYDPLTLLPNRRLFHDRLEQEVGKSQRDGASLALLLIDLDHFKAVNDTLGHDAGDVLLVDAARRIHACVRETDTVARLGGDEFTIILPGLQGPERARDVAAAIVESLGLPFRIGEHTARVAASVGIALFPNDGGDGAALLRNADRAMYAAKHAGRSRYCFSAETPEERQPD